MKKIGIIGGSGLEDFSFSDEKIIKEVKHTLYGDTSPIGQISLDDKLLYIVSRHGINHEHGPSDVNYQANIYFLAKLAKCDFIIITTACGSLRENIKKGTLCFPTQFIDWTNQISRKNSYYRYGKSLSHTSMGHPIDTGKYRDLIETKEPAGKTIITIEGPRFSTMSESNMFRLLGADIINMTSSTEIALANELDIPVIVIAMVTDYDAWKEDEAPADWKEIKKVMNENSNKVIALLKKIIQSY